MKPDLVAAPPPAVDPTRALRHTLGHYPTGVAVVTTHAPDGRRVGLTVNSFASLSLEPPLVLWSLANRSPNLATFRESGRFVVNLLAASQAALARRFANGAIADKFDGVPLEAPWHEVPVLADTLGWIACHTPEVLQGGDHTLFVGRVEGHACRGGDALVFHRGRFGSTSALEEIAS